jgi:hypothetical protein
MFVCLKKKSEFFGFVFLVVSKKNNEKKEENTRKWKSQNILRREQSGPI